MVGCSLLLASGRPLTTLAETLASHARIHTADGEHFRDALARAAERCKLPVTRVRERELLARGAAQLRFAEGELQRRVAEMGRAVGPPWRQDEKLAALAAWTVLGASRR